jgi:hypothetical protein
MILLVRSKEPAEHRYRFDATLSCMKFDAWREKLGVALLRRSESLRA